MKTKTLIILIVILCVLAGGGFIINYLKSTDRVESRMGAFLLETLPANQVASIIIKSPGEAVSLMKKNERWVVKTRFDYPADFSKIYDLVRKFKTVKIGRSFGASEDTRLRLLLKDPDDPNAPGKEQGTRVFLKDDKLVTLANILLGKVRQTGGERRFPDGQYVMMGQTSEIHLIDGHFSSIGKDSSSWLAKDLIKVEAKDINRITCFSPGGEDMQYELARFAKGKDLELAGISTDREVDKSVINRVAGALSSLRMDDVADPSTDPKSIDMETPPLIAYHLYNGIIYRLYPSSGCSKNERCHLRIQVGYEKPLDVKDDAGKEETKIEGDKKKVSKPEKSPEEYALEAKNLNERLSPWVFVIPKWKHDALITELDQLYKKPVEGKGKRKG